MKTLEKRMSMKTFVFAAGILFLSGVCVTSCKEDDNPEPAAAAANYAYSVIVGDNSYVGVFDNFEDISSLNNSNSFVHAKSALLYPYKDYLYVLEFESNEKLVQYRKKDGDLELVKTLSLPAQSYPVGLTFKDDKTAYLSLAYTGQMLVVNTEDLSITGNPVDFTPYGLENCFVAPGQAIIRDGLMFVSLAQYIAVNYPSPGAYIAVVDVATNQPVKLISTQLSSNTCALDYAGDPFVDENGDIYFCSIGGYGYIPGDKEGFLRIKKGETEFDESYYFPIADKTISGVPGNAANYVYQKAYMGNGKVYGYANIPGAASEIPDYTNDRSMQPVVIDIYAKTIERLELEPSVGWSCCIAKTGDKLVWGMLSTQGAGLYLYNPATRQTDKFISTTGSPYRVFEFK
ncbi:MAG: DUF4374 domain-containing protein [Tannerella sp.]|jgi:hypothetical protein|nr:DUF4374 domain-containing protein [Tannerella sp.]